MDYQYQSGYVKGEKQLEEGTFFKAIPFEIVIQGHSFFMEFKHTDDHRVVYDVVCDDDVVMSLAHPDYVPKWVEDQTLMRVSLPHDIDPLIFLHALMSVGISKGKALAGFLQSFSLVHLTYKILQKGPVF
mgnify:CR=1 FL=1